jgi:hypothetical protein
MSFLSSHRLHWGEHDALTGHLLTHLEVHLHDLPLAHAAEGDPPPFSAEPEPAPPAGSGLSPDTRLPDIPGP